MKDVMLDLETLGTRHDALIIQIGACYFDRNTGEIGLGFSANTDAGEMTDEFTIDLSTIKWWFGQSDTARKLVTEAPIPMVDALIGLSQFLHKPDITIWSHATFDIPILVNAFETAGIKFPVPFRNMRDIRTLMDLSQHRSETPRDGMHHNALDDAKYQAMYCSEAMKKLNANA
jgi:hypothetical protein